MTGHGTDGSVAIPMVLFLHHLLELARLPTATTILMRHADERETLYTPFDAWLTNRALFDSYQAGQPVSKRKSLQRATHWASFVVTPARETLFIGLYEAGYLGPTAEPRYEPLTGMTQSPQTYDLYRLQKLGLLSDFEGRLTIDWGAAFRARVQRADGAPKRILEIRQFQDPPFPGPTDFVTPLSRIETLPKSWKEVLRNLRGVYVLTCPRTSELYVGSASGDHGFLGRWLEYARNGHGQNALLIKRDPADFDVSILETLGSTASTEDVVCREVRWKAKLRPSLNAN